MNKKKLLFVVNVDTFFISHRLPIALKAIKQGYEVHLLCAITDTDNYELLKSYKLIIHPISISRSGKNLFREFFTIFSFYKYIKSINPDLLHLVSIKPVIYGGIVARILNVPSVLSAISGLGFLFVKSPSFRTRSLRYVVLFLYRMAINHPNQQVLFQNQTDRNELVKKVGLDKNKTQLIRGSGVNLSCYPAKPEIDGVPVVVMASRLLKDKGVNEFVDAARCLLSRGVNANFWLAGNPDPENPSSITVEAFEGWKRENIVDCLGFKTNIAELFSKSHIVVLPSYREGLPKVLIEAAACGRAVITTDVPGCRDAIESDVTGLLIPARDAKALADTIEDLIQNPNKRRCLGQAGRKLAEKEFTIEKIVDAHMKIYEELLSKDESKT